MFRAKAEPNLPHSQLCNAILAAKLYPTPIPSMYCSSSLSPQNATGVLKAVAGYCSDRAVMEGRSLGGKRFFTSSLLARRGAAAPAADEGP